MKAARFEDGGVRIHEVPVPDPKRDQALVHIRTAGVCHSDLHLARGEWAGVPQMSLIGHEAIGVVESVAPGAERFVDVGDRVILGLGSAGGGYWCGSCEYCLRGSPRHCAKTRPVIGTFAEYFAIWAPALVKLPDTVGDLEAPLACGGLTAYGAGHARAGGLARRRAGQHPRLAPRPAVRSRRHLRGARCRQLPGEGGRRRPDELNGG
jgi:alcohol dehydrogenase, propanol-preferring